MRDILKVLIDFNKFFLLILSLIIVAFGTPSISNSLSILASIGGYALFWCSLCYFRRKFLVSFLWFASVQAVQINWMTSIKYMGPFILVVYLFLSLAIGVQFGILSRMIQFPLTYRKCAAVASVWVFFEWSRLFFLTGFPWNPNGMALAANPYSIQFSSLFGVYGLCFWVIFINLLALKIFVEPERKKNGMIWASCASLPFLFGMGHQIFWEKFMVQGSEKTVALVQTAILPEQKEMTSKDPSRMHPLVQWERILFALAETEKKQFDYVVLPEAALPIRATLPCYPFEDVKRIWGKYFDDVHFPEFSAIFAQKTGENDWKVNNAFWAQCIADYFNAEVVIGLDNVQDLQRYNGAFHFAPKKKTLDWYHKRMLVPIGEYIPLNHWKMVSKFLASQFGITGSMKEGKTPKVFSGAVPIGIVICSEEIYSHLVRDVRRLGSAFLVSIANDIWFPNSRLPKIHLDHGRLRAAENGTFLLRSCNTGVTCLVDCFGKVVSEFSQWDEELGVLSASFKIGHFPTLYTLFGDLPILILSGFFLIFHIAGIYSSRLRFL